MITIKQFFTTFLLKKKDNCPPPRVYRNKTSDDMYFRDCFIDFLKGLDGANRSRSYASDLATASHILEGLGHYRMREINKTILKTYINGFTKKTYTTGKGGKTKTQYYSQSAIDKVYNLLHSFIKEVSCNDGDQLLPADYMANIKKPRSNRPKAEETKPLTDEEIIMISSIVKENKLINVWIHILLYTGVRPSEPLALQFSDIHYKEKTIDVFRTLSQEEYFDPLTQKRVKPRKAVITDLKNQRDDGGINYQRRTLKVGDELINILQDWEHYIKSNTALMAEKKRHGTENYLFSGPHGQLWLYDDYKQVYERLLKRHGLSVSEYNPYRFRHNCCTRLLRLGISIKAVQLILGDNSSEMVMKVYANLDKSDILKGSTSFSESIDETLGIMSDTKISE